ncbi:MAG: cyclic nucleotide-binding domain-containing protein [Candidatus Electrothrix sp. YB6]
MEYRNAVFVVTSEDSCPIYNAGEEIQIQDAAVSVDYEKPVCLILTRELHKALSKKPGEQRFTQMSMQRASFRCPGCTGSMRFEYKKERGFSTLQMNLLRIADKKARKRHVEALFKHLRTMQVFELLEDHDLLDLISMLKLKQFDPNKVIISEGARGTHLYIILSGKVAIVKGEEVIAEIGRGEIFGEMSLLSGEPASSSVHSRTVVKFGTINGKDLKFILNRYPVLQIFFYRLLVNRAQMNMARTGKISSGMSGELIYINPVELFQLINSGGKSGKVDLIFSDGHATILFKEGEIIDAAYGDLKGKEALFALLTKRKGSFTYNTELSRKYEDLPVLGGFMGLLMEGLQRIDEEGLEQKEQAS